jgi:anti-anti-sigma factor
MTTSDIAATRHLPGSRQVQMTVTGHESGFLIHVSGQLTVATSCSFRRQLGTLVHAGPRSLLVDLENVSDIDPAGLAVLDGVGQVPLCCKNEFVSGFYHGFTRFQ